MAEAPNSQESGPGTDPKADSPIGVLVFVRQHPAATASFALSAMVLLRIMGAAKWDVTVGQAFVAAGDTASIVLGAFVSLFPLLASWLLTIAASQVAYWIREAVSERDYWSGFSRLVILLVIGTFAFMTVPAALFGFLAFITALAFFQRTRKALNVTRDALSLLLVVALGFVATTDVWLPEEIIGFDDGRRVVGYVVEDGGAWTTILTERNREIEHIMSETIERRTVCQTESSRWWERSPYDRLYDSPEPLPCEEHF